jgi:peptidoglycan hydrolase-like protein with peptidoglycan-binding domain
MLRVGVYAMRIFPLFRLPALNFRLSSAITFGLPVFSLLFFMSCFAEPALAQSPGSGEIRKQQEALIWTTEYEGLIDGVAGPETTRAINKYQDRMGHPMTGVLTPDESVALISEGTAIRARAKFRQVTDDGAGVSVGIPAALVSGPTPTKWGKHWDGKQGLAIDTLRFGADVSLKDLHDRLVSINNRKITYDRLVDDQWFVIAAFEGDAAVYVRANVVQPVNQQPEIRGFSVWMSKNRPSDYQAIPPAMLSSFRSNTDTSKDVSPNLLIGGELVDVKPKLAPNPPPVIQPIAAAGAAPSLGACYHGLGPGCPGVLSSFR